MFSYYKCCILNLDVTEYKLNSASPSFIQRLLRNSELLIVTLQNVASIRGIVVVLISE